MQFFQFFSFRLLYKPKNKQLKLIFVLFKARELDLNLNCHTHRNIH